MRKAFTLVELAIVITLIGLIVAGITTGQELLNQSKIRAAISDVDELKAKYNTFRSTYGSIPGDSSSARAFFSSCAETPANCNGDGDGNIEWAAGVTDEVYKALLHMNRAELISHPISNLPNAHVGDDQDIAIPGPFKGSGIYFGGFDTAILADTTTGVFDGDIGIYIGVYDGALGYIDAAVNAETAWGIDKKVDDGAVSGSNFTGYDTGAFQAKNDSSTTTCISGSSYNFNTANSACLIGFKVN